MNQPGQAWLFLLALLGVTFANYWAASTRGKVFGRWVLVATNLPGLALVGYAGFKLLYAIFHPEEMERRMAAHDLTYFMVDFGFAVFTLIAVVWATATYIGYGVGRKTNPDS